MTQSRQHANPEGMKSTGARNEHKDQTEVHIFFAIFAAFFRTVAPNEATLGICLWENFSGSSAKYSHMTFHWLD